MEIGDRQVSHIPPPSSHWNETLTEDELQTLIDLLQINCTVPLSPCHMAMIRTYWRTKHTAMLQFVTGLYQDQDKIAMWKGLALPYDQLPLHINSPWFGERMVVKWRLIIGR